VTIDIPPDRPVTLVNPFLVPGSEDNPDRPLCPWKDDNKAHHNYYEPVDNTDEAFHEFTGLVMPERLRNHGRLVVVTGPEGCGKTALTNRCAAWLRTQLGRWKLRGLIVDLTALRISTLNVDARVKRVWTAMLDIVGEAGEVDGGDIPDSMELGLRRFSRALQPDLILIVLLPPTDDAVGELVEYAGLAIGHLLLFAESSWSAKVADRRAEVRAAAQNPPIELSVSTLRAEDFWVFADNRQQRYAEVSGNTIVHVTRQTMGRVSADAGQRLPGWSVRRLHRTLVGASEHKLAKSPSGGELTYDDFKDYAWWESLREGRN